MLTSEMCEGALHCGQMQVAATVMSRYVDWPCIVVVRELTQLYTQRIVKHDAPALEA